MTHPKPCGLYGRPFLFRNAYLLQYVIGAAAEIERVWLARLTCLSDKSKRAQVGKISALKTMFKMVQKTHDKTLPQIGENLYHAGENWHVDCLRNNDI